jgi:radical SAM enzyme (TIGR01210 family)
MSNPATTTSVAVRYPEALEERSRWISSLRGPRNPVSVTEPYAFLVEQERSESGAVVPVATVFLTNRECPWRCLMCDLWKNTLTESVPAGAIPKQIDHALARLAPAKQIKLYNSGSFFDPRAIPPADHQDIARRIDAFERVIVECHPSLIGESAVRFRDMLKGKLEVAMGLETVHPEILPRLNKRMTLEQFARAADFLRENQIALRVFVLVKPPFLPEAEAAGWASRSADFAFDCGATVVSLIPTRSGNGAMETLAARGEFSPPSLATFEEAMDQVLAKSRGRVFADTWDLERFSNCPACFPDRRARLERLNLSQTPEPEVECVHCGQTATRQLK